MGRPGLDPADGSDLWFMAHPKEEPLNHSLATVQRGTRGVPATRDHGIKIHCEFNADIAFQHSSSPILVRLSPNENSIA